ncbi:hypothetical protein MO867_21520, partial [Microbulbifer sp. OS29]
STFLLPFAVQGQVELRTQTVIAKPPKKQPTVFAICKTAFNIDKFHMRPRDIAGGYIPFVTTKISETSTGDLYPIPLGISKRACVYC